VTEKSGLVICSEKSSIAFARSLIIDSVIGDLTNTLRKLTRL
jgi:hypothetical protein